METILQYHFQTNYNREQTYMQNRDMLQIYTEFVHNSLIPQKNKEPNLKL